MHTDDDVDRPSGMNVSVRWRRRRFFLIRVADELTLDIHALFRGSIVLDSRVQCALLCPVSGEALPMTAAELAAVMKVPSDRWVASSELGQEPEDGQARLADLAQRGILLSDPAPESWRDLADAEQSLVHMQWLDLAAVFHAHTRWRGVRGRNAPEVYDDEHSPLFERLKQIRGDPPPHFHSRPDALERMPLRVPALEGPFFEVLLARRTTRAFRSREPLPRSLLETLLYAVFGTHGVKQEPGISGIKRTSPSGGALHPIEAYLLVLNVEGVAAGLYHYETATHALALLELMNPARAVEVASEFTAGQAYFAAAHVLVIHVARFHRNYWKYAQHQKAYKAILMDSAHLSQTFYLSAAHLGLGAFYTAAINDVDIGARLRLKPLYEAAIAISGAGLPAAGRDDLHFVPDPYWPTET